MQDVPFLALRLYCLSLGIFGYPCCCIILKLTRQGQHRAGGEVCCLLLPCVALQDVPFLALRLYCLSLGIFGYSLLFYTVKNVLIIVLEAYRFTVLVLRCVRPGFDERPPVSTTETVLERIDSLCLVERTV